MMCEMKKSHSDKKHMISNQAVADFVKKAFIKMYTSQDVAKIKVWLKKNKDQLLSGWAVLMLIVTAIIAARLFVNYLKTRPIPLKVADKKTGYLFEAASNDITIRLGKQQTNTPVIQVSSGKSAMSFIFEGAKKTTTSPTQKNNSLLF